MLALRNFLLSLVYVKVLNMSSGGIKVGLWAWWVHVLDVDGFYGTEKGSVAGQPKTKEEAKRISPGVGAGRNHRQL